MPRKYAHPRLQANYGHGHQIMAQTWEERFEKSSFLLFLIFFFCFFLIGDIGEAMRPHSPPFFSFRFLCQHKH